MYKCLVSILSLRNIPSIPFSKEEIKESLKNIDCGNVTGRPVKGEKREWNSFSHGKELFEKPKGTSWHQAHNTALFLHLFATMLRALLHPEEMINWKRFHADVRALTAMLDVKYKEKINSKTMDKKQNCRSRKKIPLETMIKSEVKRLLDDVLKKVKLKAPNEDEANELVFPGY